MGPKHPHRSVLVEVEEAAVVALRVQTCPPLNDGFFALKRTIPRVIRSTLHHYLHPHGRSAYRSRIDGNRRQFDACEIGFFHVDTTEVRHVREKAHRYVAADRTSKLASRYERRGSELDFVHLNR